MDPGYSTLDPTHNESGYNEYLAIKSRFLCIKLIDCNLKKLGYNEHPLITSRFLLHLFTRCKRVPVYNQFLIFHAELIRFIVSYVHVQSQNLHGKVETNVHG